MATIQENAVAREARRERVLTEIHYEQWTAWPVSWSSVWIGALSALAAALVFGLIGIAVGAHLLGTENRIVDLRRIAIGTLIFSVCGSFFAFVIGGWVASRAAGTQRCEPAMLHGAVTWLVATPALMLLAALGAGTFFGSWYGGLGGSPAWAVPASAPFDRPEALLATATEAERAQYAAEMADYRTKVRQWKEDTPKAARNSALVALTALLLGLVGSVIGGWLASGEPMTFSHYRTRNGILTT
jgi:uncharacterized membrane protein YeaQ/YmgE (transglycosylase-associated protein family)